MKKKTYKVLLTVVCLSAAGICYSCSGADRLSDQQSVLMLDGAEADARGEAASEGGGRDREDPLAGGASELDASGRENPAREDLSEGESAGRENLADGYPAGAGDSVPASEARQVLYVHVCGEVNRPGVYEMEPGGRIFQAVEKAGGFTRQAAEGYLNMALEVSDGMKIVVPAVSDLIGEDEVRIAGDGESLSGGSGEAGTGGGESVSGGSRYEESLSGGSGDVGTGGGESVSGGSGSGAVGFNERAARLYGLGTGTGAAADGILEAGEGAAPDGGSGPAPGGGAAQSAEAGQEGRSPGSDGRVNLNTADKAALMTLKGIGETRAQDILEYRQSHGSFQRIEDIMKVPGIKEGAFEKIKDDITV